MTERHEYAVRWRTHGDPGTRIRHFSNRITADAFAHGLPGTLGDQERLAELRIDRRTVGPWETVEQVIAEPRP